MVTIDLITQSTNISLYIIFQKPSKFDYPTVHNIGDTPAIKINMYQPNSPSRGAHTTSDRSDKSASKYSSYLGVDGKFQLNFFCYHL